MWRGPAMQRLDPGQRMLPAVTVVAMPGVAWGTAGHGPALSAPGLRSALGWRRARLSGRATARTHGVVLCQAVRLGLVGLVECGARACRPAGRTLP